MGSWMTGLLCVGFILIVIVLLILKRGRIPTKFALIWLIPAILIILLALFPNLFYFFAKIVGFQTISNVAIGMLFVLLFFIILALTVIIAGQTTKINLLIQEISLLKEQVNKK